MLEILDHLLGGFTENKAIRISAPCGTTGHLLGGEEAGLVRMLNSLDHFLGALTAKTTLRISASRDTLDRLIGWKKPNYCIYWNF